MLTHADISVQSVFSYCVIEITFRYIHLKTEETGMNFSELFRQSSQICKFSTDGKYLVSRMVVLFMCNVVNAISAENCTTSYETSNSYFHEFLVHVTPC